MSVRLSTMAMLLALCECVLACRALAQAQDERSRAQVIVEESTSPCIDAIDLATRIDEILGRDAVADEGELRIDIRMRPSGSGTTLVIVLSDAAGARAVREIVHDSASCEALVGTLSVVAAMLLDDGARDAELDVTEVVPAAAAIDALPPAPARASEPRWWSGFAMGAALAFGLMPESMPGVELRGVAGEVGGASGGFSLTVFPRGVASGTPGGDFTAFTGALSVCTPRWSDALPFWLAGCAGASAGAMRGVGTGVDRAIERFEPLVLLDAFAELGLDVARPLAVALRIGFSVPVVRPAFAVLIEGERSLIHEPWPVLPTAALSFSFADRE